MYLYAYVYVLVHKQLQYDSSWDLALRRGFYTKTRREILLGLGNGMLCR